MGIILAFVIWIVAIAFIYAFMQGRAQSSALAGVIRVTALRTVMFAGQSALVEASHVLRHPPPGAGTVLDSIGSGRNSGIADDPQATRDLYASVLPGVHLTIDPVDYEVVHRPAKKDVRDPWIIELSVRVTYDSSATGVPSFSREIRRVLTGRLCEVTETLGPQQGKVVYSSLYIWGDPIVESVTP